MKGIILAGGTGTRLYPLTKVCCKQLLPVFDKPMIYYPLSTLMLAGIKDICIISTPKDTPVLKDFLGDGSRFGLNFSYIVQQLPKGIAEAFILGKDFIGDDNVTLILGDNIFYGDFGLIQAIRDHKNGATIFGYPVTNPRDFGVIEFDNEGKVISIEEKPQKPKSNYIVPGLYIYDNDVIDIATKLKPSKRLEYEITDVNVEYLNRGKLRVYPMGRGVAWLDSGTTSALSEASTFVEIVEARQGLKMACPEEIALRLGFISLDKFKNEIDNMSRCQYRTYLEGVYREVYAKANNISLGQLGICDKNLLQNL